MTASQPLPDEPEFNEETKQALRDSMDRTNLTRHDSLEDFLRWFDRLVSTPHDQPQPDWYSNAVALFGRTGGSDNPPCPDSSRP